MIEAVLYSRRIVYQLCYDHDRMFMPGLSGIFHTCPCRIVGQPVQNEHGYELGGLGAEGNILSILFDLLANATRRNVWLTYSACLQQHLRLFCDLPSLMQNRPKIEPSLFRQVLASDSLVELMVKFDIAKPPKHCRVHNLISFIDPRPITNLPSCVLIAKIHADRTCNIRSIATS